MTHLLNPYFMHLMKGMMAFILVITLVADTAAQDDCPYAVSYTHLRAHETRSNLV